MGRVQDPGSNCLKNSQSQELKIHSTLGNRSDTSVVLGNSLSAKIHGSCFMYPYFSFV